MALMAALTGAALAIPLPAQKALTGLSPPKSQTPTSSARRIGWAMRGHENLALSLERAGVAAADADRAAQALADDFDVVNPHPGFGLTLWLGPGAGSTGETLLRLALTAPDGAAVSLARAQDGAFSVSRAAPSTAVSGAVLSGTVNGSLFLSVADAGAPELAEKVERLFGRDLDLTRDIESGDRFRLLVERPSTATDEAADVEILFAEIDTRSGPRRFYHVESADGAAEWLPESGQAPRTLLLRTPVQHAQVTSPFGLRLHPILGYTRMHQGVDFGAPAGSPVLAAADGVVEQERWNGGYGRWLEIRHTDRLETGYAHLEAWAPGIAPGTRVRQGEVIGYVGASGPATGPHLHFEVRLDGRPIDPASAPRAPIAAAYASRGEFLAQKARIDAIAARLNG
ncbi:MAG TPA: M23 family metallopeptidase [Caulobacteraceae bacterium]|nr:M23 family metallopeptidase [Caulobacteraceae bacterium]